jgi:hypothetical protein
MSKKPENRVGKYLDAADMSDEFASAIERQLQFMVDRGMTWPDAMREFAAELRRSADVLEHESNKGKWIMPLTEEQKRTLDFHKEQLQHERQDAIDSIGVIATAIKEDDHRANATYTLAAVILLASDRICERLEALQSEA